VALPEFDLQSNFPTDYFPTGMASPISNKILPGGIPPECDLSDSFSELQRLNIPVIN